jgi:hypothetical protein
MTRTWRLLSAIELAEEAPYTFYRPSEALLAKLAPGHAVKLVFEFDSDDPETPAAERMWVQITTRDGERLQGRLDNQPAFIRDLRPDDPIDFEARHVIQVDGLEDPQDDPTERYRGRCFVSRRVLHEAAGAGFLYREASEHELDTGWRILSGDEPDGYLDDEDHAFFVSLGAVLNQDDSFLHLLATPAPCAFKRDPATGHYDPAPPPAGEEE